MFVKIWLVICVGIFTLQITDMADYGHGRLQTWQIMDMVDFIRSKLHLDVVKMAAEWRDLPKKDLGLNLRPPASRLSHQQKAIQSFHSISQSFSQRHPHHLHTAASSFDCSQ